MRVRSGPLEAKAGRRPQERAHVLGNLHSARPKCNCWWDCTTCPMSMAHPPRACCSHLPGSKATAIMSVSTAAARRCNLRRSLSVIQNGLCVCTGCTKARWEKYVWNLLRQVHGFCTFCQSHHMKTIKFFTYWIINEWHWRAAGSLGVSRVYVLILAPVWMKVWV